MSKVGIVCDSTCDMGPEWLAEHQVVMVPLKVSFGPETYDDWVDLAAERFYELLASSPALPKTSQPAPAQFQAAYESLARAGCDQIVSIHLAAALSGTYASAVLAAESSPVPVTVIDTFSVSVGMGLVLEAAIAARDAGADAMGVERAAREVMATLHVYCALDTLDYLVKGGRAGRAAALAADLLKIKPVLYFDEKGAVGLHKKVRGTRRAIAEMAAVAAAAAEGRPLRIAILHSLATDLVDRLIAALDEAGVRYSVLAVRPTGAVIGTYSGPRALGIAFCVAR